MSAGWAAWRSRARELPPGRLRAVVDELLVHVGDLLAPGRAAVEAYLDAVAADVADYLRPRVRAAVLVEDRLVAEDHAHLLAEAAERGLDERRAAAVVAALAAELGASVEPVAGEGGGPTVAQPARPDAEGAELLRQARAALRAGRPREARTLVDARSRRGRGDRAGARAVGRDRSCAGRGERRVRPQRRAAAAGGAGSRRWRSSTTSRAPPRTPSRTWRNTAPGRAPRWRRPTSASPRHWPDRRSDRAAALRAVLADCRDHAGPRGTRGAHRRRRPRRPRGSAPPATAAATSSCCGPRRTRTASPTACAACSPTARGR